MIRIRVRATSRGGGGLMGSPDFLSELGPCSSSLPCPEVAVKAMMVRCCPVPV